MRTIVDEAAAEGWQEIVPGVFFRELPDGSREVRSSGSLGRMTITQAERIEALHRMAERRAAAELQTGWR